MLLGVLGFSFSGKHGVASLQISVVSFLNSADALKSALYSGDAHYVRKILSAEMEHRLMVDWSK